MPTDLYTPIVKREIYQVLPRNDLKQHAERGEWCHCKPRIDRSGDNILVIHNAYDGREFYESENDVYE